MLEAEQTKEQEHIENFSKNPKNIMRVSDGQLTDQSSFDHFNKYPVYIAITVINNESDDEANAIGIRSKINLSKSEKNIQEKEILNAAKVPLSINSFLTNRQTGNFLQKKEKKKTRLLVKRGVAHISLLLIDIALIYTKDKLVFVIDHDLKKYSIDKTLTELENELDHNIFFRANRQYIINLNFIKSFKAYQKVKLLVDMYIPNLEEPIIVSQQVAPIFKKWMNDA